MLFTDSFHTVSRVAEGLFKDRGSKFFGYAFPVLNEMQIKERLQELRKQHPSARHHCYAWRLGPDHQAFRANDDGEPSGTGGKPILGQIQSNDLTNVLVVVVRYFGGTLLGVSGLINAYRSGAAAALAEAGKELRHIEYDYRLDFDSEDMNAVMRALKELEAVITANSYEERNFVLFRLKKQHVDKLEEKARDLFKVKLQLIKLVQE